MEFTAKCLLINAVKKKSKKGSEYTQVILLDNETGESFITYSGELEMLKLNKIKEYVFVFSFTNKFKNFKIIGYRE